ncbi:MULTISPECIES: lipocalin family protein [unclassified Salinibacterium]|uniref:lipocalin family protein n=1 Tax=unclassified Salinibacterium TaxID=2632331 RepID=UPI001422763A|nr:MULTISPECIES: lipocalin family protein [unclassified Salinibacterium]
MTNATEVRAIDHLDVDRYLGQWFEIGRLPLKWEPKGARDITAQYSANDDGTIRIDNRCIDDKGEPTQSVGRAKQTGEKTSELTVTFLPEFLRWIPFTEGDYWVLRIDDDYAYSLVGTPDRKNLWLLSRTPQAEATVIDSYLETARSMGFDLADWIVPEQSGSIVSDAQLENA